MKRKTAIWIGAGAVVGWLVYQSQKKGAETVATTVSLQQQALKDATAAAQGTVHGFGADMLKPRPGRTIYEGGQQVLGADLLTQHQGRMVYAGGQQVLGDPRLVDDMCEPSYSRGTINYFQPIEGLDGIGRSFKKFTRGVAKHSIVGKIVKKIAPKSVRRVLAKVDPTRPKPAPVAAPGEEIVYQDTNGNVITEAEYNRQVAEAEAANASAPAVPVLTPRKFIKHGSGNNGLPEGATRSSTAAQVDALRRQQAPDLPPAPPQTQFTASSSGAPGLPESISQLQLPTGQAVQSAPAEAPKTNIAPLVGVGAAAALLMAFS